MKVPADDYWVIGFQPGRFPKPAHGVRGLPDRRREVPMVNRGRRYDLLHRIPGVSEIRTMALPTIVQARLFPDPHSWRMYENLKARFEARYLSLNL